LADWDFREESFLSSATRARELICLVDNPISGIQPNVSIESRYTYAPVFFEGDSNTLTIERVVRGDISASQSSR
jgi:hypothetical protein